MIKKLGITLLFVLIANLLFAKDRYGWHHETLYGDVQSVTVTTYNVKDHFGQIVKNGLNEKVVYLFNSQGDVTEYTTYCEGKGFFSSLDIYKKNIYKYDEQHDIIEEITYDGDGSMSNKRIFKYVLYNGLKKKTEEASYKRDGSLSEKILYKHNYQGKNEVEEYYYKGDGTLQFIEIYIYQTSKPYNLLEKIRIGEMLTFASDATSVQYNDEWSFKDIYEYNNKGEMIKKVSYHHSKIFGVEEIGKITYKYNTGRVTEIRSEFQFSSNNKVLIYTYDSDGNLIEVSQFDKDGKLEEKYINEYDENRNRIYTVYYIGEIMKPITITEYDITYRK